YGSIDLSPLSGPTPAPVGPSPSGVQPPPATPIVLLEESTTSAALEIALSTRARLQTDAVWQVSGGADETSRNSVPLARGPRLRSQFGYLLTHLDRLDAELGGFDTRYSNGRRVSAANALLGWGRALWHGATLRLGGGPAVGRGEDPRAGT